MKMAWKESTQKNLDEGLGYPEEQRIYDINGNGILRRIIWLPTATEISRVHYSSIFRY